MFPLEQWVLVDKKGRITIPQRIRERAGIQDGSTAVKVAWENGEIRILTQKEMGNK